MRIYEMKTCLFGCHLRTGTELIAWSLLIVSCVTINYSVIQAIDISNNYEAIYKDGYRPYGNIGDLTSEDRDRMEQLKIDKLCQYASYILVGAFVFVLDVPLLIGVYKAKPNLIRPAIWVALFALCVAELKCFSDAWDNGIRREVFHEIFFTALFFYCFSIVYSHYKQLIIHSRGFSDVLGTQVLTQDMLVNKKPATGPVEPNMTVQAV